MTEQQHINAQKESAADRSANRTSKATVWIACSTIVALLVAIIQLSVYRGQLKVARLEHQPNVGLSAIQEIKDSTAVYLSFQNFGKSTAYKTSIGVRSEVPSTAPADLFNGQCINDCRIKDFEMTPGVPVGFRVPRIEQTQIPPGAIQRIIVRIDYWDDEGAPHNLGICVLKSPNDFGTCPEPGSNYRDK
jgi:hypothetical protein